MSPVLLLGTCKEKAEKQKDREGAGTGWRSWGAVIEAEQIVHPVQEAVNQEAYTAKWLQRANVLLSAVAPRVSLALSLTLSLSFVPHLNGIEPRDTWPGGLAYFNNDGLQSHEIHLLMWFGSTWNKIKRRDKSTWRLNETSLWGTALSSVLTT